MDFFPMNNIVFFLINRFSVILPSKFLIFLIGKLIFMKKNFILFVTVFFMFSCEDDQTRESEDCAGVMGGDNVCGCTDEQGNEL